jgi:site-specific recombinase XerD
VQTRPLLGARLVLGTANSNFLTQLSQLRKLSKGIEDKRQKVVFHTLRHTYASWLVERGADLYTVKELMGHKTLAMTERYSHLGENTLKQAVSRLDESLEYSTFETPKVEF